MRHFYFGRAVQFGVLVHIIVCEIDANPYVIIHIICVNLSLEKSSQTMYGIQNLKNCLT